MAKIGEIVRFMDERYPFGVAEEFDNVGLLVGDPEQTVTCCRLALDATTAVIREAAAGGAELLITHHPIIFDPLRRLTPDTPAVQAVIHGVAVLSSHTCLDKAVGGVNDVLAARLHLCDVKLLENGDGILRGGVLESPMEPAAFAVFCKMSLQAEGVRAVLGRKPIRSVALCSGAGGSYLAAVLAAGYDAYLTGELKHHEAVAAQNAGITVVDAGHFETETVVLEKIKGELEQAFPDVSFSVSPENQPLMRWL